MIILNVMPATCFKQFETGETKQHPREAQSFTSKGWGEVQHFVRHMTFPGTPKQKISKNEEAVFVLFDSEISLFLMQPLLEVYIGLVLIG